MRNNSLSAALLICVLMLLCVAGGVQAQSGRRGQARTPAPSPPVQKTSEAETDSPKPAAKPEAQSVSLVLTYDEDLGGAGFFVGDSKLVLRGFMDRLEKNSTIKHKVEHQMDRKEASDFARSQKDTYVVWLQLSRRMISSRTENNDLFVEYAVFIPGTGKSKTEGRVYVRDPRRGIGIGNVPIGLPPPPTSTGGIRRDDELLDAGRETAERVMPKLDVIQVASSQ
jgi:hypothetical protein